MEEVGEERQRRIRLKCPSVSVSKIVELVAGEDQRLDLGFISRAFGLEPKSLKLNGHFISRGLDLIACSVTWRSLLSFFSARGFSTGASDSDAIIVDGKLSRLGSKRKHDAHYLGNRSLTTEQPGVSDPNENPQLAHPDLVCKKRCYKGFLSKIDLTGSNFLSLRRKLSAIDANALKRSRTDEASSGFQENHFDLSKGISNGKFSCSLLGENVKRMREDNMVVASPCKRLRC